MLFAVSDADLPWVVKIIQNALRGLYANLCQLIYPLIGTFYQVFTEMGKLLYNNSFTKIYNKISTIIGIFMVFRVIFWLIELLVNPDTISDKEKSPTKIIQKVLLVVVLLATTPRIFKIAFDVQYEIINNSVIEELIALPNDNGEVEVFGSEATGRRMAAKLFSNFYYYNESGQNDNDNCRMFTGEDGLINSDILNYNSLEKLGYKCLTSRYDDVGEVEGEYKIYFNGLFAVGIGAFVFWMILMYCISVGTRYVQLIFLQVIAPIPIMCYLTPKKDNMFSKWVKQCTTTYLDLFIRVSIISFILLLINQLFDQPGLFTNVADGKYGGWITLFLVLGLLTFAKKAPDLIQELLPKSVTKASGDFGLSLKKRTDAMLGGKLMYNATKRAPGFVAGGVTGSLIGGVMGAKGGKGFGSRLAGFTSGAARGFATGSKKGNVFKNVGEVRKNQAAQNNKLQQWRIAANKGENEPNTLGDYISRKADANRRAMGFETNGQVLERRTKVANEAADSQKNILEYGKGKSKEKNTRLTAFGKDVGIAEMESRSKQATAAYENNSVEKLMSTPEGETTLRMAARRKYEENVKRSRMARGESESQAQAWMDQHSSYLDKSFNNTYGSMTEKDKQTLAEEEMARLQKVSLAAKDEFNDYEKRAAFSFLVSDKDAQNVKNDFATITAFLKTDKDFAAVALSDYIKKKNGLKPGTDDYKNYNVDSSSITDDLISEVFDLDKLSDLKAEAESGNATAMGEFEGTFKAFDMFKNLKSRYAAENATPEALRDKANDKFNSSK